MKKIYFLSLVFTIGFCLVLGSCRSGNRKKQNVVATQTDRSNIRYAQGFWLEQHENYRLLHIKDPQSETGSEYTFALRQRGTHPELPPHIPVLDLPIRGVICMTSLQLSNFIKLGATSQVVGISSTRFLNNATIKQQLAEGKTQKGNFDAEIIMNLAPDLILISPFKQGGYDAMKEVDIPLVPHLGYKETTPLGQAEWIKFVGLLIGEEEKANKIFNEIEQKYNDLKRLTARVDQSCSVVKYTEEHGMP